MTPEKKLEIRVRLSKDILLRTWDVAIRDFRAGLPPQYQDYEGLRVNGMRPPWQVAGGA